MYGDRRVRPTFARESASVVVTLGRNGNLRIPSGLVPWRLGQRVFFRFNADRSITMSLTPQGLHRGRYMSSVLKRTVWRKYDANFTRRVASGDCAGREEWNPIWFRVNGIRHSALVRACTEAEAVRKAVEKRAIDDWEADFGLSVIPIGLKLPDVLTW
jgi:hypothetical protein